MCMHCSWVCLGFWPDLCRVWASPALASFFLGSSHLTFQWQWLPKRCWVFYFNSLSSCLFLKADVVNIGVCMYVFSMLELYAYVLGSVRNGRRNMAMIGGMGKGYWSRWDGGHRVFRHCSWIFPSNLVSTSTVFFLKLNRVLQIEQLSLWQCGVLMKDAHLEHLCFFISRGSWE